ncbi:TetR family transcriptional regulator [Microbacterium sp. 1P10UB]|uniref:TetR/AcrR family transcriptional regulator n=1 Tax=unclassified Microbacterium TaxID=2609290 RepID=UPI0039A04B0C
MNTPPSRRGMERKAHILDVGLRIIGRDGLTNLSLRTLAAEAEVPLGALGYYFLSKEQFIVEAFDAHLERELRRVIGTAAAIDAARSPQDVTRLLADFLIDGLRSPENALVAEYEFIVAASRRADLAQRAGAWQRSFQALLRNTLGRLGSPEPDADARLVMATMAGLEIDNLSPAPLDQARLADIRRSVARMVTLMSATWTTSTDPDNETMENRR